MAGQPWQVAVASAREGLGISRFSAAGRLEFPVLQKLEGNPSSLASLAQPGGVSLPAVIVEKEKSWSLQVLTPSPEGPWSEPGDVASDTTAARSIVT